MAKFVDVNPSSGLQMWEDMTVDGKLQIHHRQDVEPVLEMAKAERINGLTDAGIKRDMWLYARIPPVVVLELRHKYGVDIFKKDHLKRAIDLINTEYPALKTTEKTHRVRG